MGLVVTLLPVPAGGSGPLEWMPAPGQAHHPVEAGRWWHAIQLPALDEQFIARSLDAAGAAAPAIRCEGRRTITWLIPIGAAARWPLPADVRLITHGHVQVPAPDTAPPHPAGPPPVWWTAPPGPSPLARPVALRVALAELAAADRPGRRA